MRILLLSWRDPKHPNAGGAEQVVHEHAKGWRASGHQVTLFASRFAASLAKQDVDGIHIVRGGYQYLGVQLSAFWFYLHHRSDFDLVIDQFHGVPFFTPLYVSCPILALIQETASNVWLLNPLPWPINYLIGLIGLVGEPFVFLFYRSVPFMTGSASSARALEKFLIPKEHIHIIPHGVLTLKPASMTKSVTTTITFLGMLSLDKGVEDALACFASLAQMGKFQFWLIGKPETPAYLIYLRGLAAKLGITDKTTFWGRVPAQQKFDLLAQSHILVNPSHHEGWGLVNIEANSTGTPVIAYSSAGLVDSVKPGVSGYLTTTNSPQALAQLIHTTLSDPASYQQLCATSIKWSLTFSWGESRATSLALITSLTQ